MTEKPFSSSESPRGENREKSLSEVRDIKRDGINISQKIAQHIELPVTGEALYEAIQEIFSTDAIIDSQTKGKESIGDTKDRSKTQSDIDGARENLLDITERRTIWTQLLEIQKNDPNMPLKDFEVMYLKKRNLSLRQIIMDILWLGAQKEEALQKINKLDSYHLPKTAALWSTIVIEVGQEYGEDILARKNINKHLYGGKISHLYERLIDPARSSARIRAASMEFSKELRTAKEIMLQAQPAMDVELAKKGLSASARKDIYGKAVVFLSENPTGKKLASMVEATAKSGVGKSTASVTSGVREGFVSPLCAAMLACSIDGAPDKEKAIIQYFTYLLAGQLAQEASKPAGRGLVKLLEKMAPTGDTKIAKIGKWLMSDVPKTKIAILTASIAVVCVAFGYKPVANQINAVAEWADQSIDHGAWREGGAKAVELIAIAASWELTLGIAVGYELIGLNGVNPFKDQLDFLAEHPGKKGLDAWNKRVSELQTQGGVGDVFQKTMGQTQKAILEEQKIQSPDIWAQQNVIPFQQQLAEFDMIDAKMKLILQSIPSSPSDAGPILKPEENLRYRKYALADNDVWNSEDHLLETGLSFKGSVITSDGTIKNRLEGENRKAITWLEDMKGSPEDRLDDYFENLDNIIAQEESKCPHLVKHPSIQTSFGNTLPKYEVDVNSEEYKKLTVWIEQVQDAKKQWTTMRATALEIAKRVTIARSLGVYNEKKWTDASVIDSDNLLFKGYAEKIARNYRVHELTRPSDAKKADEIMDAVGTAPKMYGDDIVSFSWQKRNNDEYKKWTEKNGFGIDDRHIHADRVKILVREAYTAGIPQEYIEDALSSVSNMARNQAEGQYITPDDVRNIESKLGSLLLDKALRDAIDTQNFSANNIFEVRYKFQQYEFSRTFIKIDGGKNVLQRDRMKNVSYRALPGGDAIQAIKSDEHLGDTTLPFDTFQKQINTIKRQIESQRNREKMEREKKQAESDAKAKLKVEKSANKSNNETAFQEYYELPGIEKEGFGKWKKINHIDKTPVIYSSQCYRGEEASAAPQKNIWEWVYPKINQRIQVACYWGPGDVAEVTLGNLKEFKYAGWDKRTQEAVKEVLVSDEPEKSLARIIGLIEGHTILETHLLGTDTYRHLPRELLDALILHLNNASDKKAFLRKTLDVLIEHGGIANGDVPGLVQSITQ